MKKLNVFTVSSVIFLLAVGFPARAQALTELKSFQDAAREHSVVFRGKQAARYTFPANGHPYWAQPAFESGDITFEGNFYRNLPMNIDAVAQRALVQLTGSPVSVALAPAQVASIVIGERRFVGIGPDEDLPEGFYEVFGKGPEQVYKHVEKKLDSSVNNVNGGVIGYYDDNYRPDVTRHFTLVSYYYFRDAAGAFTPFRSRSALIRQFPERKREIRRALRTSGIDVSNFDTYCKAVLNIAAQ